MAVVAALIILAGVYLWWREASVRRRFQAVDGEITKSQLGKLNARPPRYFPEVTFRYVVDGKTFEEGRYRLFMRAQRVSETAAKIAAGFRVGERVRAWYDPAKPSTAVIDRSVSRLGPVAIVIGAVIAAAAVYRGGGW